MKEKTEKMMKAGVLREDVKEFGYLRIFIYKIYSIYIHKKEKLNEKIEKQKRNKVKI